MFKNIIKGKIVKGYRVASGISKNSPYPAGSIKMQMPYFKKLGLAFYNYYPATLNINIFPKKFELRNPQHTFRNVKWSLDNPHEDFSFSACNVIYKNKLYEGYIYYPHPETKSDHFHDGSTIEIITKYIKDVYYYSEIKLIFNQNELAILY